MIQKSRIQQLNDRPVSQGKYVVYWMQASQRTRYNHALEYAIREANKQSVPLVVYFELIDDFPEANARHYCFMLEGLRVVEQALKEEGIRFVVNYRTGKKYPDLQHISRDAKLVIVDRGYLRIQKQWRDLYARTLPCPLIQVESDIIIPVDIASQKEEFSASTFRRKTISLRHEYMRPFRHSRPKHSSLHLRFESFPLGNIDKAIAEMRIDHSVGRSPIYHGGMAEAKKRLAEFLKVRLVHYSDCRNDPSKECLSNLSPYLHFGHISPLEVAILVGREDSSGVAAFLEELTVRRELAINFTHYNPEYDSLNCLHDWSRSSLAEHRRDRREHVYSLEDFEQAQTHDLYWNAAQEEMVITGKMHGYMRMYWGKKILEWSETPEEGFETALHLNNKYEIDGRDPNGFAGVAWCFGKHDRAWGERKVFGKVRYMSADGLRRKFDIEGYVRRVQSLGGHFR